MTEQPPRLDGLSCKGARELRVPTKVIELEEGTAGLFESGRRMMASAARHSPPARTRPKRGPQRQYLASSLSRRGPSASEKNMHIFGHPIHTHTGTPLGQLRRPPGRPRERLELALVLGRERRVHRREGRLFARELFVKVARVGRRGLSDGWRGSVHGAGRERRVKGGPRRDARWPGRRDSGCACGRRRPSWCP